MNLARRAMDLGLRFSVEDPFDVVCRYADFALIRSGHSPNAHNFTYGQLEGWPVRTFDFRYEVGHGTRRTMRRYSVILLQTRLPLASVLIWQEAPARMGRQWVLDGPDFAPIAVKDVDGQIGPWKYVGDGQLGARLAEVYREVAQAGTCIQVQGSTILIALRCEKDGQRDGDMSEIIRLASQIEPGGVTPAPATAAGVPEETKR